MSRPSLHDEIKDILIANGNPWMATREIAALVNERGRYQKGDGSPVKANQISARVRHPRYSNMFEVAGTVRLYRSEMN